MVFSSFLISFKNSSRNFNGDILRLVFAFAFLAFVGCVAAYGVGLPVWILMFCCKKSAFKVIKNFFSYTKW